MVSNSNEYLGRSFEEIYNQNLKSVSDCVFLKISCVNLVKNIFTCFSHQGNMTVHGALSVLLDSCLCAMAPLIFLTSRIPEIDGIPNQTKVNEIF